MGKTVHIGLDVGSTTVKTVVMNEKLDVIYTSYDRHFSDTKNTVYNCLENLIKKYKCGTLYLENNGDKGYLEKEFRHRKIRCKGYHERMNKYTKICTYLYKAWKNITWLKNTDDVYMGQILDYTEMAEHDDALEISNLIRVIETNKVNFIKGLNI